MFLASYEALYTLIHINAIDIILVNKDFGEQMSSLTSTVPNGQKRWKGFLVFIMNFGRRLKSRPT